MYEELEQRSPRRFQTALGASFSILSILYAAFATIAYLRFGPTVPANVLNDLGTGAWGSAARVGMSVVVLCVYPIMVKPMVAPLDGFVARRGGSPAGSSPPPSGRWVAKAAAVGIVGSVMLCAFFVSSLGLMSVISGALSVGGFVGGAPGLVGLFLSEHRSGTCWRLSMHLLIWGGLAVSILGFVYTDNFVDELGGACWLNLNASNVR